MKRKFLGILVLALAVLGCPQKKQEPPLYLLALLFNPGNGSTGSADPLVSNVVVATEGQTGAGDSTPNESSTTPSTPVSIPVKVNLEEILVSHSSGLCPLFGGLLLSYEKGEEKTCRLNTLNSDCAKIALGSDLNPRKIDPRSFAGYTLPIEQMASSSIYPSTGKSDVFCFDREKPISLTQIRLYAYRNRSSGSIPNNCPTAMTGEFCDERLVLPSPTKFKIPKEFPLLLESGSIGNSGDHWLELKYKNEQDRFVTCIYRGNNLNSFGVSAGTFTKNAYIGANPNLQYRKGYCLVCTLGFCNYNLGSGLGPFTGENAFYEEYVLSDVVGTTVTAKEFIILSVKNGNGALKHTVDWLVEGYEPVSSDLGNLGLVAYYEGAMKGYEIWLALGLMVFGLMSGILLKKRSQARY